MGVGDAGSILVGSRFGLRHGSPARCSPSLSAAHTKRSHLHPALSPQPLRPQASQPPQKPRLLAHHEPHAHITLAAATCDGVRALANGSAAWSTGVGR